MGDLIYDSKTMHMKGKLLCICIIIKVSYLLMIYSTSLSFYYTIIIENVHPFENYYPIVSYFTRHPFSGLLPRIFESDCCFSYANRTQSPVFIE